MAGSRRTLSLFRVCHFKTENSREDILDMKKQMKSHLQNQYLNMPLTSSEFGSATNVQGSYKSDLGMSRLFLRFGPPTPGSRRPKFWTRRRRDESGGVAARTEPSEQPTLLLFLPSRRFVLSLLLFLGGGELRELCTRHKKLESGSFLVANEGSQTQRLQADAGPGISELFFSGLKPIRGDKLS